jgi:hypothetical protein
LLVAAGIGFITTATTYITTWLIDTFPLLGKIG